MDKKAISKSIAELGLGPLSCQVHGAEPGKNSNPNPDCKLGEWNLCCVQQLEMMLLDSLDFLYNEAVSKLVALGFDEDVALNAVVRNGHCYGGLDVLTNILHNALLYLNHGCTDNYDESEPPPFADLRHLVEFSLSAMVSLLQQIRPHLTKGDAMLSLLMNELHVGRASGMEPSGISSPSSDGSMPMFSTLESLANNSNVVAPALCRFHGDDDPFLYASVIPLQKRLECPKRFNLTPSVKALLKRNVAIFAAGFKANSKPFPTRFQASRRSKAKSQASPRSKTQCQASPSSKTQSQASPSSKTQSQASPSSKTQSQASPTLVFGSGVPTIENDDGVCSMLSKLKIDENKTLTGEQKDEMVLSLMYEIKDLQRQVEERKEWAHEKAIQAANKLSGDLTELKVLRMERDETHRLKKGKQNLEDTTMKRLSEMENSLRKASAQVDSANAAVRRLEIGNAEIRAEMEASKLSASESADACSEVAKREKRSLKKLMAWEKQKAKLMEENATEKKKISELYQQLNQIKKLQKDVEERRKQEQKAQELALAQIEEERRLKDATEVGNKRKNEVMRQKIEIDCQRYKDDLQRLEQEISRLKVPAQLTTTELLGQSNILSTRNNLTGAAKPHGESILKMIRELQIQEEDDSWDNGEEVNRECLICMKNEVSVVFLPCAHQVICANCNDGYAKKGNATCPCCQGPIIQRICVFGASS